MLLGYPRMPKALFYRLSRKLLIINILNIPKM